MKEFLIQWKQYGFRVTLNNFLLIYTMRFVGARRYKVDYLTDERISDEFRPLGMRVIEFYRWADSRNTIPTKYKKGIEWFINSLQDFDND